MRLQIIQLEDYDDVVSVRDRLAFLQADRVLLVWPKSGQILDRKLDLVLIQRAAAHAGLRLGLVTRDSMARQNAAELNLPVFDSVDAGSRVRWKRPRDKVFVDRASRPPERLDRYELMQAAGRLHPLTAQQQRRRRIVRLGAVVASLLAIILLAYFVFPSATVRLYPARDQLTTTLNLTADPTITVENINTGRIPANLAQNLLVQRQASIATSGLSNVPATLASGTVIFSNQTTQALTIPKGTIVETPDSTNPAQFQTTADAALPAGGTVEVTIEAMPNTAGPDGNIQANLIAKVSGDLAASVTVHNANPTQGGTSREQKIVTEQDRQQLLTLIRQQILSDAIADVPLTPTQFIVPGSIKILEERPEWTTFSAFVGDPADTLTLTMQARLQALIVDELPARRVAYANLAGQLGDRQIVVDSLAYQRGRIDPIHPDGTATFLLTASADAVSQIDPEAVREQISGAGLGRAQAMLEQSWLLDPLRPPQIDVQPPFFGRLPLLPFRIDVQISP